MAGCVANTATIATALDGAGTLRSDAIVAPGANNPLVAQADGLAVKAQHVTYGWPNIVGDDTYATPAGVAPTFGPLVYGPELVAQSATSTPGCVTAAVNWEVQAAYAGSNTFSGITFELQGSNDHATWVTMATAAYHQPASLTILHHFSLLWPQCWPDNGLHTMWVRCVLTAGSFGTGDVVTAQLTRRRGITMMY